VESPNGAWRIRRTEPDSSGDLDALAALRFRWRADERGERGMDAVAFREALAHWVREHRDTHEGWLGELDGEAVAMAWLAVVDRVPGPGQLVRRGGYVQSVYVVPEHRNRGLGAELMTSLVARARERGLDWLAVHPSAFAVSFYRRLGFAPTPGVLELDWRAPRESR
jgi:GNAT superfamily N-acetyltransferase